MNSVVNVVEDQVFYQKVIFMRSVGDNKVFSFRLRNG